MASVKMIYPLATYTSFVNESISTEVMINYEVVKPT